MAVKKTVEEGVSVTPVLTPIQRRQEESRNATAIVRKHTINSTEGQPMFTNEDAIYEEMSLSPEQATKLLGGRDPLDYFKKGLIHSSNVSVFGDLLSEDREEVMMVRKVLRGVDVPVFKHRKFNQYLLLIPKVYSENETDSNDEYTSKHVYSDYRVIAFTGQMGVPASYEETFFEKELNKIAALLKIEGAKRGYTLV
jgi:hypothetical protein